MSAPSPTRPPSWRGCAEGKARLSPVNRARKPYIGALPPETTANDPAARHEGWGTLRRFLPYLWPRDNPALRWRVVVALVLILLSTATQLALP